MLFSTAVPLDALVQFCRMVRHGLAAGLSLVDVFRQQARKGPPAIRPVADAVVARLEQGEGLEDALKAEGGRLPPLFHAMAAVGEHSGHLPEVFHELERYYELQSRLRKQFLADIAWPVIQFVMATFVIALMLFVLGFIAQMTNTTAMDPLGLGLTGARGAIVFLVAVWGTVFGVWAGYRLLAYQLNKKPAVDRFLLRLPALGPALEALALARFCLGLRLTLGAGLPIKPALRRSLEATDNAAYGVRLEEALAVLRKGDDLTTILRACQIFPGDFLDIVSNAEEGGRVPEVMEQQARFYQEEASRKLTILARVAGFGVWLFVAILLIVAIFRIFVTAYLGPLNQALQGF